MTMTATVKFVMLQGRELRAASAALQILADSAKDKSRDVSELIKDALKMCYVAIGDIQPDQCIQVYEPPEPTYREIYNIDDDKADKVKK